MSDIEKVPSYEVGPGVNRSGSTPRLGGSTRELDSDYYLGGYDIDSDYPPPQEDEFLSQDQLLPPLPRNEDYPENDSTLPADQESTLSVGSAGHQHARPHFHPSQYLPPHQLPLCETLSGGIPGEEIHTSASGMIAGKGDTDDTAQLLNMQLSVGVSSASDVSAHCSLDDFEPGSDFGSMDEFRCGMTIITDSQQQTEVWLTNNDMGSIVGQKKHTAQMYRGIQQKL